MSRPILSRILARRRALPRRPWPGPAWLGLAAALLAVQVQAAPFGPFGPRDLAMGGTGTAAAGAASAAHYNPALLAFARERERFALALPAVLRLADPDDLRGAVDDFQAARYIPDFRDAVEAFNASPQPFAVKAAGPLGDRVVQAAQRLVNALPTLSGKALEGEGHLALALAVPRAGWGLALTGSLRALGGAELSIAQQDIDNFNAVIRGLQAKDPSGITQAGRLIDFSSGQLMASALLGRGAVLGEGGLTLARAFGAKGRRAAVGLTPKLVRVETFDYAVNLETADLSVDQGRKGYTGFNLDAGLALGEGEGWRAGLVARDLLRKRYRTALGNELRLRPQLRAGLAYRWRRAVLAADLDLTRNDPVGLDSATRFASLGGEWDLGGHLQLRAGLRHDLEGHLDTAYGAGLGLSVLGLHLDVAAMASGKELGAALRLALARGA